MLFPARYTDAQGTIDTWIANDGRNLKMVLEGVTFIGHDFDSLELAESDPDSIPKRFTIHPKWNQLCNCQLECDIPVQVIHGDDLLAGTLTMQLRLGKPDHRNAIDEERLSLRLLAGPLDLRTRNPDIGTFEEGLLELQHLFPAETHFKNCFGCAFSDYSVYGNGLFGGLLCFRNQKEAYRNVRSKSDYLKIMDDACEMVQETYLCGEYEARQPRTGYRG
ncbi:MAG: DUF6304 family protein [Cytophagales bacterium]|nr:DUF6304 family protein [Cytophagales bacterium]